MKKIGVVTHYYKSDNYGGNLQAYALCKFLQKKGYFAQQISFDYFTELTSKATKHNFFYLFTKLLKAPNKENVLKGIDRLSMYVKKKQLARNREKKREAFCFFNQHIIPHTDVYSAHTISECVSFFDAFITGSDQVWNPTSYLPAFFLDFVPSEKIKISYAASVALTKLSDEQSNLFYQHLQDFDAISVREDSAVDLVQPLTEITVKQVLDPALLLEKEDWDAVCSERIISEDYVFCYFLGYNQKERKLAKQYAKKHNLKLVTIPMINYGLSVADVGFGDVKMNNASVQDFISLIKYAKRVFTDSFHASVFSIIYSTPFFVFQRGKNDEMSSRITSLLSLFSEEARFCMYKIGLPYLEQLDGKGLQPSYEKYNEKKKESIAFLIESLG